MSKKQRQESQAEQSERFRKESQKLIDGGELEPTEAEATVDTLVRRAADKRKT